MKGLNVLAERRCHINASENTQAGGISSLSGLEDYRFRLHSSSDDHNYHVIKMLRDYSMNASIQKQNSKYCKVKKSLLYPTWGRAELLDWYR